MLDLHGDVQAVNAGQGDRLPRPRDSVGGLSGRRDAGAPRPGPVAGQPARLVAHVWLDPGQATPAELTVAPVAP
jgi:hypothetical protein